MSASPVTLLIMTFFFFSLLPLEGEEVGEEAEVVEGAEVAEEGEEETVELGGSPFSYYIFVKCKLNETTYD